MENAKNLIFGKIGNVFGILEEIFGIVVCAFIMEECLVAIDAIFFFTFFSPFFLHPIGWTVFPDASANGFP